VATAEQIAQLRRYMNDAIVPQRFSDVVLGAAIDAADSDPASAAGTLWLEVAAGYSTAVDMSENGSSRKMSDLQKNALAMAAVFTEQATAGTGPARRGVRIRPIVRGSAER
jgi:hypothetical protein